MRFLYLAVLMVSSLALAREKDFAFPLSADLLKGSETVFIAHNDPAPFGSYLTMNLPQPPSKELFDVLVSEFQIVLKNRGEAHITVITPPEYENVLKPYLSMEEINRIALEAEIQKAEVSPLCLGRGRARDGHLLMETYYVVVKANRLLEIRRRIAAKYVQHGGDPSRFDPNYFYPHITIGFTSRDLQDSDGVFKGVNSCIASFKVDN